MLPIQRVDGGVLLPLDQLHKLARDQGIMRMPNQVFVPDKVIADAMALSGVSVEQVQTHNNNSVEELQNKPLDTPTATIPQSILVRASGRPDGATAPVMRFDSPAHESVYEKVRKQVVSGSDQPTLQQELQGITFSEDQDRAYNGIVNMRGYSSFMTGEAGTGKTLVSKRVRAYHDVAVCATTGVAAMLAGGPTVDSMFSYDRTTGEVRSEKRLKLVMEVTPQTIMIDEGSAIGARMATYLLNVAKRFNKRLAIVGDLAQTSPVKDGWATETELFLNAEVFKLQQVHRQSDSRYLRALRQVRHGIVDDDVRDVFRQCWSPDPPSDDSYIRLFATNAATDAYNNARLLSVPGESKLWRLYAQYFDTRDEEVQERYPVSPDAQNQKLMDSRMAHGTQFRVGARVMVTMNDPSEDRLYVNGDLGTIVRAELSDGTNVDDMPDFNPFMSNGAREPRPDYVLVRLDRNGETVRLGKHDQEVKDALGKPQFSIRGIPVRLGWAVTIHKAQGLTVDKAFLDMETITYMKGESKHGLAYVALSRTRTLEGLLIQNWRDDAVYCSPAVRKFI